MYYVKGCVVQAAIWEVEAFWQTKGPSQLMRDLGQ